MVSGPVLRLQEDKPVEINLVDDRAARDDITATLWP